MKISKCPASIPPIDGKPCGYEAKEAADPLYCPKCDAYYRGVSPGIKVRVDKADLEMLGLSA